MDFIAQLNLRELREVVVADELPENGMLYVFYGGESGEMNEGRLMYTSEPTEHLQRSNRLNHEDWLVSGRPLKFSVGWNLPDIHSLAFMDMRKEAPLKYADSDGSEVAIYSEALYSVGPRYSENCVMTMFGHAGCSVYGGTYPEPDDVEDPCIYIHESSRPSPSNKATSRINQARSICAQWTHLIELNSFYEDPEKRPLCPKFSWGDGFPYQFWIHNDDLDQFDVEKAIGEMAP